MTTASPPNFDHVEINADERSAPGEPDYNAQIAYWEGIESTVNGMLGGYPQVSRIDLQGSSNFLVKLRRLMGTKAAEGASGEGSGKVVKRGVDCGAGIGRITKGLLANHLDVVDIVEPIKKFTDEIAEGEEFADLVAAGKIGEIYNVGLEKWEPEEGRYWLIWNQWCLNHLTTADLTSYLQRCAKALAPGGLIVVKENITNCGYDVFDPDDSSVTRTDEGYRKIFSDAGLVVVKSELQKGFPQSLGLFPVRMYALRGV